jgi:putative membrane protein
MSRRFWITAAMILCLAASAPALAQNAQKQGQPNSPPATPAALSGQDQSFLQQAAEAAASEIKLGQLAVDKASSPEVKQFGQQSINDFGKAQKDLDKIAGNLKWIAPDHMSQNAVGQYDDLWQRQGKDFDSHYMGDEISNYQNYVPLFENEADHGTDHQLALYAQSLLPTLRARLYTAKQIGQKVGS